MTDVECPLIPMGAITGTPDRDAIAKFLQSYRDVGITQFMIYARSGCELEYMSDAWLDACEIICEEAQRLGFTSLWIYDEYNWPSGSCKGSVIWEKPDYALKQLCVYQERGEHKIAIRRNPRMADLMDPDAVACFIRLTHEKYASRLQKYFGGLIKGFFTDEPDIAFFSHDNKEDVLRMPYYQGLEEDYAAQTQRDLRADIVCGVKIGSDFYRETCNRLFARRFAITFAERISEWCAGHGMVLTGHLMDEFSPNALACSGHPLEVLSKFSVPGMDEIFTRQSCDTVEWLTLGTAQYAVEKRGNVGGVAELFALGPCDISFAKMRKQLWLCAAFGIDRFVMAVAQLDMRGNVEKSAYYNPFSSTQPWFPALREFGEEAQKVALFARKQRAVQVNVRYPYTPTPLTDLLRHLTAAQCDWRLLLPGEQPDANVVLSLEGGQIREEISGKTFYDFGMLHECFLKSRVQQESQIETEDGAPCSWVFVRRYTDGSVLVIDLTQQSRNLILCRYGQHLPFVLPAYGVITFPGWLVTLDRPNTMRAEFENQIFKFELDDRIPDLCLAIRHYGGTPQVTLDGEPAIAEDTVTSLPEGFQSLYKQVSLQSIAAGNHQLELSNQVADYPYLPAVILTGTFSRDENRLRVYQNDGCGLQGYAGIISQQAKITIPNNATVASINTDEEFCVELIIDGQSIGKRLWSPYEWVLPQGIQGKEVDVEIKRFTSCGQIFGSKCFGSAEDWLAAYKPDNTHAPTPTCELLWK